MWQSTEIFFVRYVTEKLRNAWRHSFILQKNTYFDWLRQVWHTDLADGLVCLCSMI